MPEQPDTALQLKARKISHSLDKVLANARHVVGFLGHQRQGAPAASQPQPHRNRWQRLLRHGRQVSSDECAVGRAQERKPRKTNNTRRTAGRREEQVAEGADGVICVEVTRGHKRVYRARGGATHGWEGFDMVDDRVAGAMRILQLAQSYLLPQDFPHSVAPQYATYMRARAAQYACSGALSVFTTRSLLGALGIGGQRKGEAAAAINWVLKDGAGRLGRLLFAKWGRELDCELKQFRLAGNVLMELSAALELSTAFAPTAFLPLACTANLTKNLAAVAASSTRAPIYRTFALHNNLADVSAKGESVANLADICGTLAGILLARHASPLVPTFCVLSAGYLIASRCEVDSIQLAYLNRARLAYAARRFLRTGVVPGLPEANRNEPLLPWGPYGQGRVVLGARVEEACAGPSDLQAALQAGALGWHLPATMLNPKETRLSSGAALSASRVPLC
ncbi:hypothetical protein WJX72_000793 [[Myrmecia] bisecta]|uniref:Protein root UVB sensitive/RUS domain-containing protein n=1 Tax=[Myrmecia] bisecta TaxID=41462 RepID=A0AAW1PJV5_9CHLO